MALSLKDLKKFRPTDARKPAQNPPAPGRRTLRPWESFADDALVEGEDTAAPSTGDSNRGQALQQNASAAASEVRSELQPGTATGDSNRGQQPGTATGDKEFASEAAKSLNRGQQPGTLTGDSNRGQPAVEPTHGSTAAPNAMVAQDSASLSTTAEPVASAKSTGDSNRGQQPGTSTGDKERRAAMSLESLIGERLSNIGPPQRGVPVSTGDKLSHKPSSTGDKLSSMAGAGDTPAWPAAAQSSTGDKLDSTRAGHAPTLPAASQSPTGDKLGGTPRAGDAPVLAAATASSSTGDKLSSASTVADSPSLLAAGKRPTGDSTSRPPVAAENATGTNAQSLAPAVLAGDAALPLGPDKDQVGHSAQVNDDRAAAALQAPQPIAAAPAAAPSAPSKGPQAPPQTPAAAKDASESKADLPTAGAVLTGDKLSVTPEPEPVAHAAAPSTPVLPAAAQAPSVQREASLAGALTPGSGSLGTAAARPKTASTSEPFLTKASVSLPFVAPERSLPDVTLEAFGGAQARPTAEITPVARRGSFDSLLPEVVFNRGQDDFNRGQRPVQPGTTGDSNRGHEAFNRGQHPVQPGTTGDNNRGQAPDELAATGRSGDSNRGQNAVQPGTTGDNNRGQIDFVPGSEGGCPRLDEPLSPDPLFDFGLKSTFVPGSPPPRPRIDPGTIPSRNRGQFPTSPQQLVVLSCLADDQEKMGVGHTGLLSRADIEQLTKVPKESVKKALQRLQAMGAVQVYGSKAGRVSGGTSYIVPREVLIELRAFNRGQIKASTGDNVQLKLPGSSSSDLLTTTTTTALMPEDGLGETFRGLAQRLALEDLGVGPTDLRRIWEQWLGLGFSPEQIPAFELSVEHLAWYARSPQAKNIRHPKAFFVTELRKGIYDAPPAFVSWAELQEQKAIEQLESRTRERERTLRRRWDSEFKLWVHNLTDAECARHMGAGLGGTSRHSRLGQERLMAAFADGHGIDLDTWKALPATDAV